MIEIKNKGHFTRTERFFNLVGKKKYLNIISKYGKKGVALLKAATPVDTGKTAASWDYSIETYPDDSISLTFTNDNEKDGENIVTLIIRGHGTRSGGYVRANNFVKPTIVPLMQELADKLWKEVTR